MTAIQDDDFLLNSGQSLVDRIPNYLSASNFDGSDRSFLPEQHLDQLVTLDTIVNELGRFNEHLALIREDARESRRQEYNLEFRQRLASWICHYAPRMFATMIHCNLNPLFLLLSMQKCQELQFTDENLPSSSSTEPPTGDFSCPFLNQDDTIMTTSTIASFHLLSPTNLLGSVHSVWYTR